MRNPFKRPTIRHDDPFNTKVQIPKELDWEDTPTFKPDDPQHAKALDMLVNAVVDDSQNEGDDKEIESNAAQDALYQAGYNAGVSAQPFDVELADDPNYWMGYVDGRGDSDEVPLAVSADAGNDLNVFGQGSFKKIEDIHTQVDKIFDSRKPVSYFPIFIDGGTKYQCEKCHFTDASETAVRNHIRLAHNYSIR